jgi:HSP20 family molecular chaperone IbpA
MRFPLLLLFVALVAVGGAARAAEPVPVPEIPAPEIPPPELRAVIVEDEADTVSVWIALPPTVDPGSVEVQLAGRVIAIRARDDTGRVLRSPPLRARDALTEEGAEARYEGSWLAITLRKDPSPPPEL